MLNGLQTLATALAAFMIGPFGISLIVLAVGGSFMGAALHWLPIRKAYEALAYGAGAFSAAYLVNMIAG